MKHLYTFFRKNLCGYLGLILCVLTGCAFCKEPVQLSHEEIYWYHKNHARILLKVKLEDGWKLYGPAQKKDTLQSSPEISSNDPKLISLMPHWPSPEAWEEEQQSAHVYTKDLFLEVDAFLQQNAEVPFPLTITLKGLSCSKVCRPVYVTHSLTLDPPKRSFEQWAHVMMLAFIGGVILNVMPCVFPVLGLKLKSFLLSSSGEFKRLCLLTVGGILTGFFLLALATIVLQEILHYQVGWGMQLQNPYFCVGIALIMMASAYSLLGVFHLYTPQWAQRYASKKQSKSYAAFGSGLLAVLLATPCSAPFLGTAIGVALTGNALEKIGFYLMIGGGFSLPYLLALVLPIGKWLPNPGPWMLWTERLMGGLLLLSGGWIILFPLSSFLSETLEKLAMVLWGIACLYPFVKKGLGAYGWTIPASLGMFLVILPTLSPKGQSISMQDGKIQWTPWSMQAMQQALDQNKIVFVDMTGSACSLCLLNKRIYTKEAVQTLLTNPLVICMRGDFSKGDEAILRFLKRYGRAAIPFNLVITKSHPQGVVLSEMLSQQEIVKTMKFIGEKAGMALSPPKET